MRFAAPSFVFLGLALAWGGSSSPDPLRDRTSGWLASLAAGAAEVETITPAAAFALGEGETLHPELTATGWRARYFTQIALPSEGEFRFGVEVLGGEASLQLWNENGAELAAGEWSEDGAFWLELHALEAGTVALQVEFVARGRGPYRLRTLWEQKPAAGRGFPPEPIPSSAASVSAEVFEVGREGVEAFEGRVLLERKGCTNCHAPTESKSRAVGRRPGPDLARVGQRLHPTWLLRWMRSPDAVRPYPDMPDLIGDAGPDETHESESIAHYLLSLSSPANAERKDVEGGRELYHRIGCVACHGALEAPATVYDDPFLPSEAPAAEVIAPLGDLRGKWRHAELVEFLRDPADAYPDGRMPDLDLKLREARALATYLIGEWEEPEFTVDPARVELGARAFVRRGCAACHALEGLPADVEGAAEAPPLAALDPQRGCLSASDATTPRYDLSDEERRRLAAGIASVQRATGAPAPLDAARRKIANLGCASCHELDGSGGVPEELDVFFVSNDEEADLGDEGRHPPDLSGAGSKLTASWLREVLLGEERARPYVATRMPRYHKELVEDLPENLARLSGVTPDDDFDEPQVSDELVLAGRGLMDRTQLSCVACHVYKDFPPNGTVGPDLTRFAERLRYEWFVSYLWNPMRFNNSTRMPSFNGGGAGESTLRTVLGGDMLRQIDAMWAYFTLGEMMPPPEAVRPERKLGLAVGDEPRVLRTFLEGAGSRGIAVGFPVGVHFGFDAEAVRLVDVWQGDFLDASGAWAGRGGNVAGGTGPRVWAAPAGLPVRLGASGEELDFEATGKEAGARFRGYRVDKAGEPTFLYEVDGARVAERWTPRAAPTVGFTRRFEITEIVAEDVIWIFGGTGLVTMKDVQGGELFLEAEIGDASNFGIRPAGPSVSFELEVVP